MQAEERTRKSSPTDLDEPLDQENTYENYFTRAANPLIEEVIEENADDPIRYETFYSGGSCDDDLPYLSTQQYRKDSLRISNNSKNNLTMEVLPGRMIRGCLDIFSFIICIILVVIQYGVIDYYYLTVLKDNIWYAWIGADALVLIIFIWLIILAFRSNQEHIEESSSTDAKVKYAWIAWFAYSIVLIGKVTACFRLFHNQLPPSLPDSNDKLFDDHLFRILLFLSILVYFFLIESHQYTQLNSMRQLYLIYLVTAICLDLLDTIYFLDLLWQTTKYHWNLPLWLDITILSLSAINFFLPTFTLIRLRFERYPRISFVSDKALALLYVLFVNGPYLAIRIYLYVFLEIQNRGKFYNADLLIIKNILMILLAMKELFVRIQFWRCNRQLRESNGGLAATAESH